MARLPRYAAPGYAHHVVQRGNNRAAMFASESDYRFFYTCLRAACERYGCEVHAYVFMTNHIHLLVTPGHAGSIGKALQSVGRRYVLYFNAVYNRTGGLWEGRYRATVVQTERYLAACYRYIERNPVRAGMVTRPTQYAWSSHRANANGDPDPLVTPHEWYLTLGGDTTSRLAAYRSLFALDDPDAVVSAIRDATKRGWAVGDARFRAELESRAGRRSRPLRAGRPTRSHRLAQSSDPLSNETMRYDSDPDFDPNFPDFRCSAAIPPANREA